MCLPVPFGFANTEALARYSHSVQLLWPHLTKHCARTRWFTNHAMHRLHMHFGVPPTTGNIPTSAFTGVANAEDCGDFHPYIRYHLVLQSIDMRDGACKQGSMTRKQSTREVTTQTLQFEHRCVKSRLPPGRFSRSRYLAVT